MKTIFAYTTILIVLITMTQVSVFGQDDTDGCTAADLETFLADGTEGLDADNLDYIYRLGELQIEFALQCGYQPTTDEIITQIDRTLNLAPLSFIIAQSSVGNDVDAAMLALETVDGDSFNGQLLYNGLEMGLDGAELGCADCHNGEAAPVVEATYTRTEDIRLALPEFADYTIEQYLVESILHPAAYIVPDYELVIMPANYGSRLDAQQLADLVAYLESQDQFIDETRHNEVDDRTQAICNDVSSDGCDFVLANIEGDSERGDELYNGIIAPEYGFVLGCASCHQMGIIGPDTDGMWTRIVEERLTLPQFEDYTAERYIAESIYIPNSFIPDEYLQSVMNLNYYDQISSQDLADLIAYIRTLE